MPRSGSIDGSDVHSLSGGVIHDELRIKNNKLRRKGTAFPSGISPKPSADIAKPSFDEKAVRSKWIWNRRKDRLNDTQQWLESKGLLKPKDRESLKSLSSQDKQRLQKLLRVSRIKEGVKSPEARLKIRAQVVLIAVRTGNLDQAAEHRKRLTERHFHTKTRLYHSLDPETFFSLKKVAGHSEELRAKEKLFREVSSQRDKSYDMGFIGPKLVNPDTLRKAVKSLIDKKLVDTKTSFDLNCILARERARDPNQVQESDQFRTTDLLWREVRRLMATNKNVRAHMAGFKGLTFTGPRLDRPKSVQKAVNMLLGNDMLDKKSAWNLRKTFEHMPNRINILMDIDRKQVPDSKDREKIRAAVLLRTAHFGTEEGRRFKDELLSKNVRYKIDIPKTDKAEARKDVAIVKKTMDLQHPGNVSKRYADEHGDSVGIPMYEDYKDVDFTNDNRRRRWK